MYTRYFKELFIKGKDVCYKVNRVYIFYIM